MFRGSPRHPWGPRFPGGGTLGHPHGDSSVEEPPVDLTLEPHLKRLVVAWRNLVSREDPDVQGGTQAPMGTQVSCQ